MIDAEGHATLARTLSEGRGRERLVKARDRRIAEGNRHPEVGIEKGKYDSYAIPSSAPKMFEVQLDDSYLRPLRAMATKFSFCMVSIPRNEAHPATSMSLSVSGTGSAEPLTFHSLRVYRFGSAVVDPAARARA